MNVGVGGTGEGVGVGVGVIGVSVGVRVGVGLVTSGVTVTGVAETDGPPVGDGVGPPFPPPGGVAVGGVVGWGVGVRLGVSVRLGVGDGPVDVPPGPGVRVRVRVGVAEVVPDGGAVAVSVAPGWLVGWTVGPGSSSAGTTETLRSAARTSTISARKGANR